MSEKATLEQELKELIITALVLEDMTPEDIPSNKALFGDDGIGLDSLDALEISLALEERYGLTVDEDEEANQRRFACISSLAEFVVESRAQ